MKLLCETKEHNKSLKFELDDLKQKLNDAQGDIKVSSEVHAIAVIYILMTCTTFCHRASSAQNVAGRCNVRWLVS